MTEQYCILLLLSNIKGFIHINRPHRYYNALRIFSSNLFVNKIVNKINLL